MAKVSICIPTYNQVKYLKRTIESVLNQTYTDYEIIITDDSPTDIVFDLVQEYKSEKIVYYKNEVSLGSPENWNEAIKISRGEYIKIMHHDDYFTSENSLFEFVEMLDKNPKSNFAFSSAVAIDIKNNKTWIHSPTSKQIENLQSDPTILFFGNFVGPPSSTIYRRNSDLVYDKNLKWVVDFDFYIQNLMSNKYFVFIDKPLITSISGELHNVTRICENNMDVEIYEYLYLSKKISVNNKKILFEKRYIKFFLNLFAKHKIESIKSIRDTGYKFKIPFILKLLIVINKIRMLFSKIRYKLKSKLSGKNKKYKKISFSQCGEDLIVKYIFDCLGIGKPSYIDIGAHHPFSLSNTALFYKNGCRGINIEPDPSLFKEFLKYRKEDINLNIGISDSNSELDFYIISSSTLNTFSKDEADKYVLEGNYFIKSIKKIEVRTLSDVLEEFSNNIFPQFLSLDAEGVDEIIIKEIDFDENFPIVICIETISFSTSGNGIKNTTLIDYIVSKGYLVYADTNINTIFVKESFWKK